MSHWQQLDIEQKVIDILGDVPDTEPGHHLGRPFLTAYQIAIEFANRYPDDAAQIGLAIGGAGAGQSNSLAQYLARQLSQGVHRGQLPQVEGGMLSNVHINDIGFNTSSGPIHSSATGSGFALSVFRLRA